MADIKRGESIFIPFRNGMSIYDSQCKPRMYKTIKGFEKHFPGHYLGKDGVELVEYVEVVHGKAVHIPAEIKPDDLLIRMDRICSECGALITRMDNYCPNCGADLRERKDND